LKKIFLIKKEWKDRCVGKKMKKIEREDQDTDNQKYENVKIM